MGYGIQIFDLDTSLIRNLRYNLSQPDERL